MIKAYIPKPIPGLRQPLFLESLPTASSRLFQTIAHEEFAGIIEQVADVLSADIVIPPHEYADLLKHPEYFAKCQAEAVHARKRMLISAYQDNPSPIDLPNAIILRPSAYKSKLRPNEIIIPGYVEDIGRKTTIPVLSKGTRPSVGFAGKAGFSGLREWARYLVRNYIFRYGPEREGVYFRRRALASLARDSRITLNSIVRRHFSANRKTVEVSPEEARRDYIRSISDSLFTLAPRGDGNFSFRFFEVLSCGRIPILIDTDCSLPLSDRIRYDDFILRVPWQETDRVGEYVVRFFETHSEDELLEMQKKALSIFEEYLYMPAFLKIVLTREYLNSIP